MNPSMSSIFIILSLTFCLSLLPCPIVSAQADLSASASASASAPASASDPASASASASQNELLARASAASSFPGSASASASQNELLARACSLAPKKDLCQETINSASDKSKKDLNDLAFIAFEAASNTSASNAEFVSQTLLDVEGSDEPEAAAVMQSFHDCQQQYEGMNDEIDDAVSAVGSRATDGQIETWLKDSIVAVETCQKSATGKGPKGEQLTGMNQKLLDLLNNAMAVFQAGKQN